jgi:hypothetical protein
MRDNGFWRGQNLGLGWNDPTFWAFGRPKKNMGSFQPGQTEAEPFSKGFARAPKSRTTGEANAANFESP